MESHRLRSSVVSGGSGKPSADEGFEEYRRRARHEYKELMKEFEFRCQRAAMMNYHEAKQYTKNLIRMEVVAALFGGVSLTTIGAWFPQFSNISHLGVVWVVVLVVVDIIIELMSKGSTRIIPSFSRRAETHMAAGSSWQALALKTESSRIVLDNPMFEASAFDVFYRQLITESVEICSKVNIPESTFRMFDDPKLVFQRLKERKQLYQRFRSL